MSLYVNREAAIFLLFLMFVVHFLELLQSSAGVKTFGTGKGTDSELETLVELHVAANGIQPLSMVFIPRVDDPSEGLRGRRQEVLA